MGGKGENERQGGNMKSQRNKEGGRERLKERVENIREGEVVGERGGGRGGRTNVSNCKTTTIL